MEAIFHTFMTVVLPVVLLVGVGVLFDRAAQPDLPTLNRLNFLVFVPALVAAKIIGSDVALSTFLGVAGIASIHALLLGLTAWGLCRVSGSPEDRPLLSASAMFYNAGNIGIPVAAMAAPAYGATIMAAILMVQNFLSFSLGIAILDRRPERRPGIIALLRALSKIPVIWAILIALGIRSSGAELPGNLSASLNYLGNGLIPVALLTLGVQLNRSRPSAEQFAGIGKGLLLRLAISPLIMALILLVVPSEYPDILLLAGGLPVAVNVFILAAEYRQQPALASQLVFWSTLLSAATIPILLAVAK